MKLLTAIREHLPAGKIIMGNGWNFFPHIIEGNLRETALNISYPYDGFGKVADLRTMLDSVIDEQNRGIINAIQFSAANTGDGLANNGVVVLFARARDKIYGLASYYLVAGNEQLFLLCR